MSTFNTDKVKIGLLYKPKALQPDKHDELVQRALLARGTRRVNWSKISPWIYVAVLFGAMLLQAAGVFG